MKRSKMGGVTIALIAAGTLIFVLVPVFLFLINISLTQLYAGNLKEAMDIALIRVYTASNPEQISEGRFVVPEQYAREVFYDEFDQAIQQMSVPETFACPVFEMTNDKGKTVLTAHTDFTGVLRREYAVSTSMEIIPDPTLEGSS